MTIGNHVFYFSVGRELKDLAAGSIDINQELRNHCCRMMIESRDRMVDNVLKQHIDRMWGGDLKEALMNIELIVNDYAHTIKILDQRQGTILEVEDLQIADFNDIYQAKMKVQNPYMYDLE